MIKLLLMTVGEKTQVLILDEVEKEVWLDGVPCALTQQEFSLLFALIQHKNTVVSREMLLQAAWGYAQAGGTRTVDVHVQRLRKKLSISCIETVFRQGYLFRAEETERDP